MLCQSCTQQQQCLPRKLAHHDRHLQGLLQKLEQCDRHHPMSRLTRWRQRVSSTWMMGLALAAIAVGVITVVHPTI